MCCESSRVRLSTVCEKVARLNVESPVEAFVCSAWISSRLTDPRTAVILSEVSRTKVMLQPRSPRISGISPLRPDDILLAVYAGPPAHIQTSQKQPRFSKKLGQKDNFITVKL